MSKKKVTGMVSIPAHLAEGEEQVHLVAKEGGGFGFAPVACRTAYTSECGHCRGESVMLWAKPRFCPHCGTEIAKPPRREYMTIEDPFESMDRDNHESLRQALREAIGDFFGERLEAQGNTICMPK